jgi:hypothetical protein
MRTMDLGVIDKDDWSRLPVISRGVAVSACRLVAYMYWPDHEDDRNRYLAPLKRFPADLNRDSQV